MRKVNVFISLLTFVLILLNLDYGSSFAIKDYALLISGLLLVISSLILLRTNKEK